MLHVHYPTEIVTLIILISKLISIELWTRGASFAPQKWGKRGPLQKLFTTKEFLQNSEIISHLQNTQ